MWKLFLITIIFNSIWRGSGVIFNAANLPYQFSLTGLVSAVVGLVSYYLLGIQFGLEGVVAGTLIIEILMAFYLFPKACKLVNRPIKDLLTSFYNDLNGLYKTLTVRLAKK